MKAIFFLFLLLIACPALALDTPHRLFLKTPQKTIELQVAFALTDPQKAQGLMGVKDLKDNQGMLFVFDEEAVRAFWMKNTPQSLDILFLDAAKKMVSMALATTPFSLDPISSDVPAMFVLEVKAGFVLKHGIKIGTALDFILPL